ncbi:ribokinase [Paenibacillus hexagrammi]|uniref:Ribokinase n=1 Tax=Paenibacillus hexagrammi TaxID=2908839 RepID=A0ABY3SPE9_9BACL|nr:ribokinase [Paenibacillus sp. YPD9-1]UJF35295.1 ribokinase [Paenibacillus sp. YPD9-1]
MRPRIAVVGSCNMDLVVSAHRMPRQGETVMGQHIRYVPGGKGANQAVGCARLGADVSMIGAVGCDVFGQGIMHALRDEQIDLSGMLQVEAEPTGTATIIHALQDNSIIVVPGANSCCSPEQVRSFRSRIEQANVLLVQLEVPLETVEAAISIAHEKKIPTVLNPAPAATLPDTILQKVTILTPNETEFEHLTGVSVEQASDETLAGVIREWELQYNHRICLTRGKFGCTYRKENVLVHVPAPHVEVVDTTGAGDAYNAALAYAISLKWPIHRAVSFAVAAGSCSVTRFGAQKGMPNLAVAMEMNSSMNSHNV